MKRSKLQNVSLDDERRRRLVSQLIGRANNKTADTMAWFDGLSANDKEALVIGIQVGLLEMVNSTKNLAACITPLLGVMVRDIQRENDGDT